MPTRRRKPTKPNADIGRARTQLVPDISVDTERANADVDRDTPCRACGRPVSKGAPKVGPWRCCPDHAKITRARIVRDLTGLVVSDEDAERLARRGVVPPVYALTGPTWNSNPQRKPWAHVDAEDRVALAAAVRDLHQPAGRTACDTGPCGFCGTVLATGWVAAGIRRQDGTPAPLCDGCARAWDRYGDGLVNLDADAVKVAVRVAATNYGGSDVNVTIPTAIERPDVGDGTPWSHLDADGFKRLQMTLWGRHGGKYCPDPVLRPLVVKSYEAAAAKQRREGRPAPAPDVWGL